VGVPDGKGGEFYAPPGCDPAPPGTGGNGAGLSADSDRLQQNRDTLNSYAAAYNATGGGKPNASLDALVKGSQKDESKFDKFKQCASDQYGFGDGDTPTGLDLGEIASEIGSLPVFKPLVGIPVIGASSRFTNVLNYGSHVLGINTRFSGAAVRSFTKAAFGSVRIATVLGRANVVIGGAMLAYDAASIAICTARDN
jgi:hypothetical protein